VTVGGRGIADRVDARLKSPAAMRNRAPIRSALAPILAGRSGVVLEIGSGSGEHVLDWATAFPQIVWQPSDPDPAAVASIAAWRDADGPANLNPPVGLDATALWTFSGPLTGVISLNVIHISPWPVTEAIVAGAAARVSAGGLLIFYGPFREGGAHTSGSNADFDASLRARNDAWGLRDLEAVENLATSAGFGPADIREMPANNRLVVFTRG